MPAPIELDTRAGKYSTIRINGEMALLEPFAVTRLTAKLESIHLPRLSGYAERYVGYALLNGELHLDTEAEIRQGVVRAINEVRVKKLEMRPLLPEEKNELTEELGMPLNTALSLLRDKNDDIELTVPVEGDVTNPEFGIGDAVRKAVGKGLAQGVKTAATIFFAPAGAILAAGKLMDLATALRFEPVGFAAGDAELTPEAIGQLDKLGPLLADRPKVSLRLGGVVTAADRTSLAEQRAKQAAPSPPEGPATEPPQPSSGSGGAPSSPGPAQEPKLVPMAIPEAELLALGEQRAEAVKDYLIERGGIDPKRLLIRRPEIVEGGEAAPRVEVSL
jgi:outer membrane protein OmpA-like peptidoglycan-associated protein